MGVGLPLILSVFLGACNPGAAAAPPDSSPTPPAATQTAVPSPTPPSLFPAVVGLSPDLPKGLVESFKESSDLSAASDIENSSLQVISGPGRPVSIWVYALVAPFPTITDNVTLDELQDFWNAKPGGDFPAKKILLSSSTRLALESLWGKTTNANVITSSSQLLRRAWNEEHTWALIPFEDIQPEWKVISIDSQSPIHKEFDSGKYPLKVSFSLQGDPAVVDAVIEKYGPASGAPFIAATNRDPNRLTTVVLTGVTALVRGTASMMELKGMIYPGQDLRDILRSADITHISNEIPFSPKCPLPHLRETDELVFCSRPQYIELLEDVGTDIVELTGDHFQDWGAEAMLYTLDLYKKEGWNYYGGGANLEEARRPVLLEHNQNKIAFLGCNAKEPGYAGASQDRPGAASCDFPLLQKQVEELVSHGFLPIVTFQHLEYYSYEAHPLLKPDFEGMAKAGAVIVSGSQAHQPHAIEFNRGAFLHYGLGNLFFDQIVEGDPTRQAFIDRHVIYNGKYINTELISIWFIDLARARLMTDEERQDLLATVFKASGW